MGGVRESRLAGEGRAPARAPSRQQGYPRHGPLGESVALTAPARLLQGSRSQPQRSRLGCRPVFPSTSAHLPRRPAGGSEGDSGPGPRAAPAPARRIPAGPLPSEDPGDGLLGGPGCCCRCCAFKAPVGGGAESGRAAAVGVAPAQPSAAARPG